MREGNKKKLFVRKAVLCVLFVVIVGGAVVLWSMFGILITAANSVEKLEDGLYYMEYKGDYGFDTFLEKGGAASDGDVANYLIEFLSRGFYKVASNVETGNFGCSTICVKTETGDTLFGRNYDWEQCHAMIVHTKPKDGYESISTCCIEFLGFGEAYAPDGSMPERMQALAAIYVPLDGMNEKGFMIADLIAGDGEETHQQSEKADLTTTTAIRLLLDKAANVDEAISLLEKYDMNSSIGSAHHFSMADASGKSVVVEYVDGEMLVTETKVVTNHYISDSLKKGIGSAQSHQRYDMLMEHNGTADETMVRDLLKSVAQMNFPPTDGSYEKTMWSIVYNPKEGCVDFYFGENYDKKYQLVLQKEDVFFYREEE